MATITRQQAICMFYCEKYNEDNVIRLSKRIDEMEDVDICYLKDDPTRPFLCSVTTIHSNPFQYHLYPAILGSKVES
ncbi:hypothetical protein DM01DRAFT_1337009 [Hesseltinella vesiculosa]|uniref:Uncharacterized protein n=1 Tax=Hesseltinella vesiculosa TaxID=101127 RepID=A0A1X2GEP5_9FUNG|nr:hypothetical protein DM01DRAFT_1337009 [Hesseltinella vesiculosa]